MQARLIEFANILRRNGIRVSLSENMDAFRALELIGIADPQMFRNALRSTLIKRTSDVKPFDELFDYFFLGIGQALDAIDRKIMEELGLSPEKFQEMLEQIQKLLQEMEGDLSDLTKALLNNNRAELERMLRDAMQQEMQNGNPETMRHTPYTRMMMRLGLDRVQSEIERFRGMLQMLGENGEDLQNVMRYLDERMRDLNRLLREIIQQEQRKQGHEPRDYSQRSSLADKSFSFYTEDDIRRMNDAVARLAQRLKNRLSVRRKKAARGRFDIKATLRKNMQYGGVPFFDSTRPPQENQAAGYGVVRYFRLGVERFTVYVAVCLLGARSLRQGAQLRVRRRDRRGDQALRRARHPDRGRDRFERRCHRRFFPFQFRPCLRAVPPQLFTLDYEQNHGVDHRRRAQ